MKYDVMCLYSIQGMITKTTQVWSSLVNCNWKMVKEIPELHAFLSFSQSGGKVGIAVLDLIVQGSSGSGRSAGSDGGSSNSQDQGRDWLVSWMDNEQGEHEKRISVSTIWMAIRRKDELS